MTAQKQTAADLITMFRQRAEEQGRVKGDAYWSSFYLTSRQADWFLGVYEAEQERKYGRRSGTSPWGPSTSLDVGDIRHVWAYRNRDGSLKVEYQSLSEAAAREQARRAEVEAEDAAWAAEHPEG